VLRESNMLYAIVCTQGNMKLQDIRNECLAQKWVPLLVFHQDDKTILPLFESATVARRFSERNLPKKWLTGAVNLDLRDGEIIGKKDIQCVVYQFPQKLKDFVEFDVEIHEYDSDKELEVKT